MKIAVITGTEVRGCTYHLKESFLTALRVGNEITEFYLPRDLPHFCTGCKLCFTESEARCPHAAYTTPIWNAMRQADLLVFAYPVYVGRAPGQVKALLDHFGCHWMVHRPDPTMFKGRAVILTQSIGASNTAAQKDVRESLTYLGISDVKRLGFGLREGVIWDALSEKRRAQIICKARRLAARYQSMKPARMGLKVRLLFAVCRLMQQQLLKNGKEPSADVQHWLDKGWIRQ